MGGQHGYIDIDFTGAMIGVAVIGVIVGIGIAKLFDWLWPVIKAVLLWSLT